MNLEEAVRDIFRKKGPGLSPQEIVHELKKQHYCTMQPTMNLRWKVGFCHEQVGPYCQLIEEGKKLEQAFSCRECGKTEWREVPEVNEEA